MAQVLVNFRMDQEDKTGDPFYSESNINYLNAITAEIDSGKAKLTEHDLIEEPLS